MYLTYVLRYCQKRYFWLDYFDYYFSHFFLEPARCGKGLSHKVFPLRFDMACFKSVKTGFPKARNALRALVLLQMSMRADAHFPSSESFARLPPTNHHHPVPRPTVGQAY